MSRLLLFLLLLFALAGACTPNSAPRAPSPTATRVQTSVSETPTGESLTTVDDLLARCPTAAQVAAIDADIDLIFANELWPGEPTHTPPATAAEHGPFGPLVCSAAEGSVDLDEVQAGAYRALLVMQYLESATTLPWTDQSLYEWFVGAVKGVQFNPSFEYSGCCEPDGVIVVSRWYDLDHWITREPQYEVTEPFVDPRSDLENSQGMFPLIALLVYQARFNEIGGHSCTLECGPGPVWDDWGLDLSPDEMGPWGTLYHFLVWLAEESDPAFLVAPGVDPDWYRECAREAAGTVLDRRFCGECHSASG